MAVTVNVQEAKTRLSELLHRVEAGEEVVIARAGTVIARLEPVAPRVRSFDAPLLPGIPPIDVAELLMPMNETDLRDWEDGHIDDPLMGARSA
ncbi:MAG: type II toxin-antitoxin system prevent-host-death family antitoxin [Propioniciclava sp.]|uniref:type II toxin-antitoxin system Phd/YefM family antitoxin n=1 Tax=Propioniciclava sp. TaxID=2038686 RepID=UPI0039E5321B